MNNPSKVIFGSLIGSGIGIAISKYLESQDSQPAGTTAEAEERPSFVESMKARWAQAKVNGDVAREAKEAELRAYFRQKVDDPTAMLDNPTI